MGAAPFDPVRLRAEMIGRIRDFFAARPALEVHTPLVNRYGITAVDIDNLPQGDGWLRTTPEYQMKQLLADGSGDIWQLGPCFRGGERGRLHNPEYRTLEWYRLGLSLDELQDEVCGLIDLLLEGSAAEVGDGWVVLGYRDFFLQHWGLDPFAADAREQLRRLALDKGAPEFRGEAADPWSDYLLEHTVASDYRDLRLVVHRFPAEMAEMAANAVEGGLKVALRFEIWVQGVELANGAVELADPAEAERRMRADNRDRKAQGLAQMPPDLDLLAALRKGLPRCAGAALGFDRLLMLFAGAERLEQVLLAARDTPALVSGAPTFGTRSGLSGQR